MENKTGIFTNIIIWFGVAISVSEIQAGVQLASLSPLNSIWIPLILGHLIGGILLFLVGLIGARIRENAMNTTRLSFGPIGSKFFASLNVLQLIAWVAVLYAQGAQALAGLNLPISFEITCILLASIVAVWVYIGINRSSKITSVVMLILTLLLVILTVKLFTMGTSNTTLINNRQSLTFWNIFEISIAMPVSWLPVISDYTKDVREPFKATLLSSIAYTVASLWMYFIGIEVVCIGANNDIAQAILLAGLGVTGVIIMVLSTITTNFLATNSAGESAKTIFKRIDIRVYGVIVSILSTLLAISGIMNHYINFLYLISSVFAPMAAVQLVHYYLGKNVDGDIRTYYWNIFSWFAGFLTYQVAGFFDSVFLGPTLLAVIVSSILCYIGIMIKK